MTRSASVQLSMLLSLIAFAGAAPAKADQILPPIGGRGGGQFFARCPAYQYLTALQLRTGDDVDAIQPVCAIAYGPTQLGPSAAFPSVLPRATVQLSCPREAPVVTGLYVRSEGVTEVVNNLHLFCGVAAAVQTPSEYPAAVFDGPAYAQTGSAGTQQCPPTLVAVGISGRSGIWLDAVGLICDVPRLTSLPAGVVVKSLGRVVPSPSATPSPPRPICEVAREARARNSPAAPGLEAQCRAITSGRAALSTSAVNSPGRAALSATQAPPVSAQTLNDLAAKGAVIAEQDAVLAQGRLAESDPGYATGFDIATGIFGDPALGALGNTAKGPGSLGMRGALSAAGQRGFDASATIHLSRRYK